jgi:hypothetical protein
LLSDDDALTSALGALLDIFGIVGTRASAMWADDVSSVLNLHFFAVIKVFQ